MLCTVCGAALTHTHTLQGGPVTVGFGHLRMHTSVPLGTCRRQGDSESVRDASGGLPRNPDGAYLGALRSPATQPWRVPLEVVPELEVELVARGATLRFHSRCPPR